MKGRSVLRVIVAVIFLSSVSVHAYAQCANPAGVAGDMTYNDNEYVMQWCDGTNWYGTARSPYIPNAVSFDQGGGDYLRLAVPLTGVSDSQLWSGSFWYRTSSSAQQTLFDDDSGGSNGFYIDFDDSNGLEIIGWNNSGTEILRMRGPVLQNNSGWQHVMWSLDLSDTNNRHLYINGIDALASVPTYNTSEIIDFTVGLYLGRQNSGGNPLNGNIADLWVDFGTYLDLSDVNVRRQFIDANGWPVNLGADGSRATGAVPDLFLSGDTATWHTNKGTGGGFTENGALTDANSQPGANLGPTGGLVLWYKLDGTNGSAWTDSSLSGNDTTLQYSGSQPRENGVIDRYHNLNVSDRQNLNAATTLATMGNMPNLTISFWGKPYTSDHDSWLFRADDIFSITNRGYAPPPSTGEMSFRANGWSGSNGNFYLSSNDGYGNNYNKWTHYAITYSYGDPVGTLPIWYVDNVPQTVNTFTTPTGVFTAAASGASNFGRDAGSSSSGWDGDLDDFRVYNRVLSAAEITELYDTGFPCKNPVGQRDGDTMYNLTHHVPQFCNLREWKAMAPGPGDGGAGCSNPTAEAGDMMYNSTSTVMQYCEGDTWKSMGKY